MSTSPLRIVFMGAPDFAVPALQALLDWPGAEVVGVFSQPARPAGRGLKLRPTPVALCAEAHHIPVFTPEKIDDEAFTQLQDLRPDLIIVAAYGLILRRRVLELAPCLNIHPSALPRWRGAAPLQRTIMAGDTQTEVCIMQMVRALDAGAVYYRQPLPLAPTETAGTLHDKAAQAGAAALLHVLTHWAEFKTAAIPQADDGITYADKINAAARQIDFTQPAHLVSCHIRGLSPWPGATTALAGHHLKVLLAEEASGAGAPGTVLHASPAEGLVIACGTGAVRLTRVQREGKKPMADSDLLQGLDIPVGTRCQ